MGDTRHAAGEYAGNTEEVHHRGSHRQAREDAGVWCMQWNIGGALSEVQDQV